MGIKYARVAVQLANNKISLFSSLSLSFSLSLPFYNIVRLQDLRNLSLANNLIEKLAHRVFYKVSKLKYLDLSGNPLTDLPPDVFTDITVRIGKMNWKCKIQLAGSAMPYNTHSQYRLLLEKKWSKVHGK